MRRPRVSRRRVAALALLPAAALTTSATAAHAQDVVGEDPVFASPAATVELSESRARFGERVRVRGEVSGPDGTRVRISFNPAGHRDWRRIARERTHDGGRYGITVRARDTGKYRAIPAGGRPTDGVRLRVRSRTRADARNWGVVGNGVPITGRVKPDNRGRRVVVEVAGQELRDRTNREGRFRVVWRPRSTGEYRVRVKARGDRHAAGSGDGAGQVRVFRPAAASYYGPGFYGGTTACGQTLTPSTLGVAHKSMPCGTRLTLRYHGRQVTVSVIDRGPYVSGREFDLTEATKQRLGFPSTGTVLTSK